MEMRIFSIHNFFVFTNSSLKIEAFFAISFSSKILSSSCSFPRAKSKAAYAHGYVTFSCFRKVGSYAPKIDECKNQLFQTIN